MRDHIGQQLDRLETAQPALRGLRLEHTLADERTRRALEGFVLCEHDRHFGATHQLLAPPPRPLQGAFAVGTMVFGNRACGSFALDSNDLTSHVSIWGRSGSGKTNLLLGLAMRLASRDVPWLLFDFKKNGRDLAPLLMGQRFVILTTGALARFTFNPLLPPPGTDRIAWTKKLNEVFCHAYFGGPGVSDTLLRAITAAYTEADDQGSVPTLSDVHRQVRAFAQAQRRESDWRQSALRILRSLDQPGTREVFTTTSNEQLEALLTMHVVLEIDQLEVDDRTFLIESLMLWLYHYRLHENQKGRLRHVLFIEEAHHVLKSRYAHQSESIVEQTIRLFRELGQSICFAEQHPSTVSMLGLASTTTKISFQQTTEQDLRALGHAMLLDERDLLGRLPVGEAIVKTGRAPNAPFMVRVCHTPIVPGLTSDETVLRLYHQVMGRRSATGTTPSRRQKPPAKRRSAPRNKSGTLSAEQRALLHDIRDHPESSVRARYQRLSWSARRGTRVQEELLEAGVIVKVPVQLTRGGRKTVLALVEQRGTPRFRGGPSYNTVARRAYEHFVRAGYRVRAEYQLGEVIVDVHACKEDKTYLVLVETGKSTVERNIERAVATGAGTVLVLATTKAAEQRSQSYCRQHDLARVIVIPSARLHEVSL